MKLLLPAFLLLCLIPSIVFAGVWSNFRLQDNLTIKTEVVEKPAEQRLGLGDRTSLKEGTGMLFVYCEASERLFWMKNMNFPIDIIWISAEKIIHIEENVPNPLPMARSSSLPIYGQGFRADMVLEVPAGYSSQKGLKAGDTAKLLP